MVGNVQELDSVRLLEKKIMAVINDQNIHPDGTKDCLSTVDLYEEYNDLSEVFSALMRALDQSKVGNFLEKYFINSQTDLGKVFKYFSESCNLNSQTQFTGIQLLTNIAGNLSGTLSLLGSDIREKYTSPQEDCCELTVGDLCLIGYLHACEMFLRWFASILKLCLCEAEGRTTPPYVAHYVVKITPFLARFVRYTYLLGTAGDEGVMASVVGVMRSTLDGENPINTLCIIDDAPFSHFVSVNDFPSTIQGCLQALNQEKETSFIPQNLLTKDDAAEERVEDTKAWLKAQINLIQSQMDNTPTDSPLYKEQERIIAYYEGRLANSTKLADEADVD